MMTRRRQQHPSPPEGIPERRQGGYRREEDDENATLAETFEHAWFIPRMLRWGKVAGAVLACSVVINGAASALNIRMIGTRDDIRTLKSDVRRIDSGAVERSSVNSRAIAVLRQNQDSLVTLMTKMNQKLFVICILSQSNRDVCKE